MIHSYDRDHAAQLVPLLESIFAEVADRRQSIRRLERELQRAKRDGEPRATISDITAQLANHRRELRMTSKEFEHLGCVVDEHTHWRQVLSQNDYECEVLKMPNWNSNMFLFSFEKQIQIQNLFFEV